MERELELVPREIIREHHFADGSSVALPGGSRAAQIDAIDQLGPGLGDQWAAYVGAFADDWDVLRRNYFERPWRPEVTDKAVVHRIFTRESVAKRVKSSFRGKDDRLRLMAAHPFVIEGHDPRDVPAWAGVVSYLEQNFGAWTVPGGMGLLAEVMTNRLATRKVDVRTGTTVTDIVVRDGRAVAVATDSGEIDADRVVCAIDPRLLPALAPHVRRTLPAIPPVVCHLGLTGDDLPEIPTEAVFHGDPMLVVRAGVRAPDGARAVTILGRGLLSEDIVIALTRRGLNLRDHVEVRIDQSPRAQVEHWRGSPMGVLWQGRSTLRDRLSTRTPIPGVFAAGAHATPVRACRTSVCRVRSSRRRSATSDSDGDLQRLEDLQRRLGPVEGVEVQARGSPANNSSQSSAATLMPSARTAAGSPSLALIRATTSSGTLVPINSPWRRIALRLRIGMMPGRIGMSTPRARTRSTSSK